MSYWTDMGLMPDIEHNERILNLPKWAQEEMLRARQRLVQCDERWQTYVADRASEVKARQPDTFVGHRFDSHTYPLPLGEAIRFVLDGDEIEARVVRRGVAAELSIRHNPSDRSGQLVVVPRVGNEVAIRVIGS